MKNNEDCEFELHQTTKVRINRILNDGVEVKTRSKKLGFIPFSNLTQDKYTLTLDQSLYVIFLGQDMNYLYFSEDTLFNPTPTPSHLVGLEMNLINYRNNIIKVIKLFLANEPANEIAAKLTIPEKEVSEIIAKFQSK